MQIDNCLNNKKNRHNNKTSKGDIISGGMGMMLEAMRLGRLSACLPFRSGNGNPLQGRFRFF